MLPFYIAALPSATLSYEGTITPPALPAFIRIILIVMAGHYLAGCPVSAGRCILRQRTPGEVLRHYGPCFT